MHRGTWYIGLQGVAAGSLNAGTPGVPELAAPAEEASFLVEVRRPFGAVDAGEAHVRAQRIAHRVDEPVGAHRLESLLPPEPEHLYASGSAVDARLDAAGQPVAEEDRQHVPAPPPLGRRVEELPDVVELEQRTEEAAVPDQRIERREERNRGRRLRRRFEQSDLVAEDEALAAHALDLDGNEVAVLNELIAERGSARMPRPPRVGLRGAEAAEDVSSAADAEQAVRAVARVELVAQLFWQRDISPKQLRREQSLEEVVVPTVAVASREAEHARERVRLEQRAHGVRRHPEPVGRAPALALEVARRQRPLRPDPLEHPLGCLGVLGDHARRSRSQLRAEPGELAGENER